MASLAQPVALCRNPNKVRILGIDLATGNVTSNVPAPPGMRTVRSQNKSGSDGVWRDDLSSDGGKNERTVIGTGRYAWEEFGNEPMRPTGSCMNFRADEFLVRTAHFLALFASS